VSLQRELWPSLVAPSPVTGVKFGQPNLSQSRLSLLQFSHRNSPMVFSSIPRDVRNLATVELRNLELVCSVTVRCLIQL
jgi:hypothetical protein